MFGYLSKSNIRTLLIIFLFFFIPLIFSHVFSLVGIIVPGLPLGYERYKFYFLLSMIFLIGLSYFKYGENIKIFTKSLILVILITGITCFYWSLFQGNICLDIIIGTQEKHHGILFFLSLGGLFWILQKEHSPKLREKLMQWSIYAAILVSVYALSQYFGLDPVNINYGDCTRNVK